MPSRNNDTKQCSKCLEIYPLNMFVKYKKSKDGLNFQCKKCTSEWRKNNRSTINKSNRKRLGDYKNNGIREYGGKCSCCGETQVVFLTIDHINNDAKQTDRIPGEKRRTCKNLWEKLAILNYPKDKYRLLCFNCNSGRAINNNICPHQNDTQKHKFKYEDEELEFMWWL